MSAAAVQYTFSGKVFPERANVSITQVRARLRASGGEIDGELRYYVALSQVTATFVCDTAVSNIWTLKNYVEDAIRVALDGLGYTLGCGYDLEVTSMIDSLGNRPVIFGVGVPVLEKVAAEAGVKFEDIMDLFKESTGGYLQHCLADLREAIRVPKDTGFFCFRAIESLRQFFIHERGAKDDKSSWQMFRESLDVDRTDIDTIKGFADPIRHGHSTEITDDQRATVFRLTWGVVNKFIKYAKAGYVEGSLTAAYTPTRAPAARG
jgi:hypothetical protein